MEIIEIQKLQYKKIITNMNKSNNNYKTKMNLIIIKLILTNNK